MCRIISGMIQRVEGELVPFVSEDSALGITVRRIDRNMCEVGYASPFPKTPTVVLTAVVDAERASTMKSGEAIVLLGSSDREGFTIILPHGHAGDGALSGINFMAMGT